MVAGPATGADVILESTGGAALTASIEALAPFGRLVTYGNASREGRPPIDAGVLSQRNLAVAGFWLPPALELPGFFREPLTEMFRLIVAGELTLPPGPAYPLAQAGRAHEDLLARRTTGKVVLVT
jgi:NADPH2:quinone reductase